MKLRRLASGLALALLLGGVVASHASAKRQTEYRYPFDRVWNAALRMVRVDMRLPVTDRDEDAGYMLFDYLDHGKRYAGSLEFVKGERNQRPYVTAVAQVQGMPSYVEQMMLDKLEKKLRAELGEPLEPVAPPPEKPKEPEKKPPADEVEPAPEPVGDEKDR